jgi:hypothetical protein
LPTAADRTFQVAVFDGSVRGQRPRGDDQIGWHDIIVLLIEALKGVGATDNKLLQAHTKADHHYPGGPRRRLI